MANASSAATPSEQDPSMEEILQSIRRIIAEDGEEQKTAGAENSEIPGSDVLELTEMVNEDGSVQKIAPQEKIDAVSEINPQDILANIDQALQPDIKPVHQETPKASEHAMEQSHTDITDESSLLSANTAAAAAASLKKIANPSAKPQPASPVPFRSGYTVEDLVLESLKPMLKDWLDKNLAQLVERVVEREVRKLSQ